MRQCRKRGRALPACAMPNATMPNASRSVSRRAATHGAPSNIAALPHYHIAALPRCVLENKILNGDDSGLSAGLG
jgi:hypothetical protein